MPPRGLVRWAVAVPVVVGRGGQCTISPGAGGGSGQLALTHTALSIISDPLPFPRVNPFLVVTPTTVTDRVVDWCTRPTRVARRVAPGRAAPFAAAGDGALEALACMADTGSQREEVSDNAGAPGRGIARHAPTPICNGRCNDVPVVAAALRESGHTQVAILTPITVLCHGTTTRTHRQLSCIRNLTGGTRTTLRLNRVLIESINETNIVNRLRPRPYFKGFWANI